MLIAVTDCLAQHSSGATTGKALVDRGVMRSLTGGLGDFAGAFVSKSSERGGRRKGIGAQDNNNHN